MYKMNRKKIKTACSANECIRLVMLHIRRVYIIGCMYQSIQSLCTKRLRSGPSYEVKGVTFSQRRKKLLIISENIRCFFVISSPVCSTFYQSEVSNRKKNILCTHCGHRIPCWTWTGYACGALSFAICIPKA